MCRGRERCQSFLIDPDYLMFDISKNLLKVLLSSKSNDFGTRAFDPLVDLAPLPSRRRKSTNRSLKKPNGNGNIENVEGNDVVKADRKVFRDTLVQKLTKSLTDMSEDKKIDAMRKVLQLHGLFN